MSERVCPRCSFESKFIECERCEFTYDPDNELPDEEKEIDVHVADFRDFGIDQLDNDALRTVAEQLEKEAETKDGDYCAMLKVSQLISIIQRLM